MEQLLSKEFLYEPLAEMSKKYPQWLAEHGHSLPPAEKDKYTKQLGVSFAKVISLRQGLESLCHSPRIASAAGVTRRRPCSSPA